MIEDEMVGWHHLPDGHEFAQIPGESEGQRCLVCSRPWGLKELDTIELLSSTRLETIRLIE